MVTTTTATPKTILVVGSTGRTGINLIQQLSELPIHAAPKIFAYCRDPSRLDDETKALCEGVIKGNATSPKDLENAIDASQADCIFVSVGAGQNLSKSVNHIRTENAKALTKVLQKPQYSHIKVMVVSSSGAGGSKIIAGFGIGMLISYHLRHVLHDHDGQEALFLSAMKDRTMIVRPTALTEFEASKSGKMKVFGDYEKPPNMKTDRLDLARWVVQEGVYGRTLKFGDKPVNLTGWN